MKPEHAAHHRRHLGIDAWKGLFKDMPRQEKVRPIRIMVFQLLEGGNDIDYSVVVQSGKLESDLLTLFMISR